MKSRCNLILSTSPLSQATRKPRKTTSLALRHRRLHGKPRRYNTVKESDSETGLYYFGARYLDPKTGRWLSGDPALGEYIPQAGRQSNGLPGMGGVYNTANLHTYHYAGNNPVKYIDPDGRKPVKYEERIRTIGYIDRIANSDLRGIVSRVYNGIEGWNTSTNRRTGANHEKAILKTSIYNYLGNINMDPRRGIAFWWACAGGAVTLRNRWITPALNPNDLAIARDLADSGQINFYTDSLGQRITDPQQLGPLLQPGDVISYQSVDAITGAVIDDTWHTATVLINDRIAGKITYVEYHEDNPKNADRRVEVWRSPYSDLGHYQDEALYGGGPWR